MIGRMINDRYELIREIGGGGMSHVYVAQDKILNNEVVVKILRFDLAREESYVRRFNREIQAVSSLSHPNIVSIFDIGEEDALSFLVMEYVRGMTLKEYIIRHSPLSFERVINLFNQIFSAVQFAHDNQIVHRDIKPQNILISDDGVIKITDFGIATITTSMTMTKTNSEMLGSVHYVSPEQVRGRKADCRSDIYSLGILLYEMLVNRVPFSGDNTVSVALKHLQEVTPSARDINPRIPQSLENVVLRATAKRPENRYQLIEEMRQDLITSLDIERIEEEPYVEPKMEDSEEVTKILPVIDDEVRISKKPEPNNKALGEKKKMKKGLKVAIVSGAVAGSLIVTLLFLLLFTNLFSTPDVKVPDVAEKSLSEGKAILEDAGFLIGKETEVSNDEIEKDFIVKTDPKENTLRKKGSKIDIYFSKGPKTQKVENYVDRFYDDVRPMIDSIGFKEVVVTYRHDGQRDAGIILEQGPLKDQEVIPGITVLNLVVSRGKEKVILSNLVGMSRSELNRYATEKNITINIKEEYSATVARDVVISQSLTPNTEIAIGGSVNVVISKGEDPASKETSLLRTFNINYSGFDGEPQLVEIYIQDNNRNINTLYDSFEIIGNVRKEIEFILLPGNTGRVRIDIDGLRYLEDTIRSS